MKKSLFIMALGAIALTSCSQDEIIEVKQDAIGFSVATENASRATTITTSDVEKFKVYAYVEENDVETEYFEEIASKDGNIFKPDNVYYWPQAEVKFCSLYPETMELNVNKQIEDYQVVNFDTYHDVDLLYSVATAQRGVDNVTSTGTAAINFRHALSKVEFKFENSALYGLDIKINSIAVMNINNKATYTLPDTETEASTGDGTEVRGEWANYGVVDAEKDLYQFNLTSLVDGVSTPLAVPANDNAVGDGVEYFVLPQTLEPATVGTWDKVYFKIDCVIKKNDVTVKNGAVAIPYEGEWKEGYKYTYTFKFGEGAGYDDGTNVPTLVPISWSITVDPMQNAEAVEIPMAVEVPGAAGE